MSAKSNPPHAAHGPAGPVACVVSLAAYEAMLGAQRRLERVAERLPWTTGAHRRKAIADLTAAVEATKAARNAFLALAGGA